MRYSRQREAILDVLKSTTVHPDAEWIYSQVRKKIKSISLGTVYRNLGEMAAAGEIRMLYADGAMHFDGNTTEHIHFACRECGRITDIFSDTNLKETLEKSGHIVSDQQLVFYGVCPECIKPNS